MPDRIAPSPSGFALAETSLAEICPALSAMAATMILLPSAMPGSRAACGFLAALDDAARGENGDGRQRLGSESTARLGKQRDRVGDSQAGAAKRLRNADAGPAEFGHVPPPRAVETRLLAAPCAHVLREV